ncbi:3-mercaptopyruvate sulfurtransferase [Rhodobacterales bacterium 52_120_T64]|nr:3-mercaptopyruvate sulfurtransferase [Rhodobacterales bacterium 52_120_T64]
MNNDSQLLVSTQWLDDHLDAPDVRILDATYFLPGAERDGRAEYDASHIPGARYFDIDDVADSRSSLPHMLPPIEKFISRVRAMGIGDGHRVVVYDTHGIFSAPRVWWMFRLFGKLDVAVLDGGMKKWIAEGRAVENTPPTVRDRHLTARRNASMVKDVTQVAASSKLGDCQIIDARAPERFRGEVPEARVELRSGHIPGSLNVYYGDLLNRDGTMKGLQDLKAAFDMAGVDLDKPTITTCGSGVTAAILTLAMARLGHQLNAVYDGSWSEWGMYNDLKVEIG